MKEVTKQIGIVGILVFLGAVARGQELVNVTNVKGIAVIDSNRQEAKKKAKQNARIEALKKAGVPEYIMVFQTQAIQSSNNSVNRSFMEDIKSELRGSVVDVDVMETGVSIKNTGPTVQEIYKYTINATVSKENLKSDPHFNAKIKGCKRVFEKGDQFVLRIKPTKNCYLTLFNIATENNEIKKLYPNKAHNLTQDKFLEGQYAKLPPQGRWNAEIPRGSERQANKLIFVFTKDQRNYQEQGKAEMDKLENIWEWIHEIPPEKRIVRYRHFDIVKP